MNLSKITSLGSFFFGFSNPLKMFRGRRHLMDMAFDAIEFEIEQIETETNIKTNFTEGEYFNVTVANFSENALKMKLNFLDPLLISNDGLTHKLIARIVNPAFFRDVNGHILATNLTYTEEIPRQHASEIEKKLTKASSVSIKTISTIEIILLIIG